MASIGLCTASRAQVVMSQNFEGVTTPALPAGWVAAHTGAGNGFVTNNGSVSWALGTLPAHTNYVFVDDLDHPGNNPAYLTSGTFSLAGISAANAYLAYDYFFFKAELSAAPHTGEGAWVDMSSDGGATWSTVDSVTALTADAWATKYVSLSAYAGMPNLMLRLGYTDNGANLIGWAADNISVFGEQANDISITAVTPVVGDPVNDYKTVGSNFTIGGTAFNGGNTTITSFDVTYQVGSLTPVVATIPCNIAPLSSYNFTCPTPYTATAVGTQPVGVWLTEAGDPVLTNDTMYTAISTVSFVPTKKLAIEEGTGTWCGWCVRGIVYMDSLKELYGNGVSLIAVHDADPMTVTAYDSWMGTQIGGYPSVVIDRTFTDDPSSLLDIYTAHHSDFGFADITLVPTWTTSTISVATTVKPALDLSGDYRLVLVLTEDGVHGTGSTWAQHDYYSVSSQNLPLTGQGVNYQDSTNPIAATSMHYNHVARVIPSVTGTAGVLPASMTAGSSYNATLTANIPAADNINFMHCVVMLVDHATGHVLNTQNADLTLGVTNVDAGLSGMRLFPNPATENTNVIFNLLSQSDVTISVYDATGRVVYTTAAQQMAKGQQNVVIPVNALAAGVYNVVIGTETGRVSDRFTVIK